jgi:hypothetical protein
MQLVGNLHGECGLEGMWARLANRKAVLDSSAGPMKPNMLAGK